VAACTHRPPDTGSAMATPSRSSRLLSDRYRQPRRSILTV
jgi:hypothetical protein